MTWDPTWVPSGGDVLTTFPRRTSWSVQRMGARDVALGALDGVTGFTVTQDLTRTICGGGTLELDDRGQGVDWLSVRVQPWWRVEVGAQVAEWPLGVFLCSVPREDWSSTGRTWRVDLMDKLAVLDADTVERSYSLPAGTVVTTAVRAIIASTGETATAITDSPERLPAGLVWRPGTSKLTIANDLLDQIGYWSLRCDGWGRYVAAPYSAPTIRPVVWTFAAGEDAIHAPAWNRAQDLAAVPNKTVLIGRGTSSTPAIVGVATNTDPASPLSYPSRGRWIVHTETDVEATSQAAIDALAARTLVELSAVSAVQTIDHAPVPLTLADVVAREWATGQARASVQAWSLTSGHDALMRTTLAEVA